MPRQRLLLLCWCFSLLAATRCPRGTALPSGHTAFTVHGHSCVSSYWNSVTCVLSVTGDPVDRFAYSLKFYDTDSNCEISCPLVPMSNFHKCVCELHSDVFISYAEYSIQLCRDSSCTNIAEEFQPSQNIQLTPPLQVEVQQSQGHFNFSWSSGYEGHPYLSDILNYEVLLQASHSKESKTLQTNSHEKTLSVRRAQLTPDPTYCVKVRSVPAHSDYNGTWSEWGPSTCWENEAGGGQGNTLSILTKSLGPVFAAFVVLLILLYSPTARKRIRSLFHTPSPAPFFKPLFQQHDGNLQEWLSSQGKFVLTYKTDEMLTTDAVVVVPKAIKKEPEESEGSHKPAVLQLEFTQCQSAYVGLPVIQEVSQSFTVDSPGDMPYTAWPCPAWGVDPGKVDIVSSAPKDHLNITRVESGSSCEDPTQSPECSSPQSPVADSPPQRNYSDYCTLNRTAEGFAPVLLKEAA